MASNLSKILEAYIKIVKHLITAQNSAKLINRKFISQFQM